MNWKCVFLISDCFQLFQVQELGLYFTVFNGQEMAHSNYLYPEGDMFALGHEWPRNID